MLNQFSETKKRLMSFVEQVKKADFVDKDVLENSELDEDVERLMQGEFKISLVAPFSAGKSTFINAVLGKDLLSMDIRAETSVITKIAFSEEIRIDVIYHEENKVERITKDEFGNRITYDECKKILKKITTVRNEMNEELIKEVIVHCPLEICRDNIELIDTPGLFSRHEKHESITNTILPQVNAVIFMIDPESVGEEHFTEKIQNYVANAKSSNLEVEGKHIFFVINKIDIFSPEDIGLARGELVEVLRDIINKPQIHEVSSYFGMIGKQLSADEIELVTVQKDNKIKIPDPEDPEYTIAGRQIKREHASNIVEFSKIQELEQALSTYLEDKNDYLLKGVKCSIENLVHDSANRMKYQIQEIENSLNNDTSIYLSRMDELRETITGLKNSTIRRINREIDQAIKGGAQGGGLDDIVDSKISRLMISVEKDIEISIYKKWSHVKGGINRENAEDIIIGLITEVEKELLLSIREMTKNSFLIIQKQISDLIEMIQELLEQVSEEIEEAEIKNLGKKIDGIGNLNIENMTGNIMNTIERQFSGALVSISKEFSLKIKGLEKDSTKSVKKAGLWNWFKGLFGKEAYEQKFDVYEFRMKLNDMMEEMSRGIANILADNKKAIRNPVLDATNLIVDEMKNEILAKIKSVIVVKEKILLDTKQEMGLNEKEKSKLIIQKKSKVAEAVAFLKSMNERI